MNSARAILLTLRPHQWVKNSFLLAALVFSKHLLDVSYALRTGAAIAAFCALSGAVYAFNDVRDAERDRQHPTKRNRPIAAGHLSERTALMVTVILTLGALAGCLALSWKLAAVGGLYFVINLVYSQWLKHIAYLDVALITVGFLLRVLAGGCAIDVPVSVWLLTCTGLLAAMLGFGKRTHELAMAHRLERDPATTRKSLAGYHGPSLSWIIIVLAISACVGYALYTRDPGTTESFGTDRLIFTLPFCVLGIARFLQLTLTSRSNDSPTEAMLRDIPFMANLLLWGVALLVIIYGGL